MAYAQIGHVRCQSKWLEREAGVGKEARGSPFCQKDEASSDLSTSTVYFTKN